MFAGVHLTSIILVCFLIELDYCSAFPRGRSQYSEWPGGRGRWERQDRNDFGIPQPLRFFRALQSKEKQQDNDQAQDNTWQMPQGRSVKGGSSNQIKDQANGIQSAPIIWPEVSPQEPEVPYPINFVSDFKPPANVWDQSTDDSGAEEWDLKWGEGDRNGYSPEFYIPTSFDSFSSSSDDANGVNIGEADTGGITFSPIQQVEDKTSDEFPVLSQPYPQPIFNEFYSAQINPFIYDGSFPHGYGISSEMPNIGFSWFPSQYEMIPGRRQADHVKPSGRKYAQPQSWPQGDTSYGQFIPSLGNWPGVQMVPFQSSLRSSYPAASPVQYGFPAFGYHKPVSSTTNYVMGNVMQVGHNNYTSAYPLQYSIGGQSAPGAGQNDFTAFAPVQTYQDFPTDVTDFAPVQTYQDFSTESQTQVLDPDVDSDRNGEDRNPTYNKLIIDVGDVPREPFNEPTYFPTKN